MKRNPTPLLFLLVAVFLQTAQARESDSALDGFDPAADGQVRSVLVTEDGSLIVAGQFQNIAGVARQRIARLHGDGTDADAYGSGANGTVFALEAAGGGKVYAGGAFGMLGGEARPNLGRLNADGSIDNDFVPTPALDGIVFALKELADGSVLARKGSVLEFRISPSLLPCPLLLRLVLLGPQPVLPDSLAHVACALQAQAFGDPILPHRSSLADRPRDRHVAKGVSPRI